MKLVICAPIPDPRGVGFVFVFKLLLVVRFSQRVMDRFVGAGLVPARLSAYPARRATTTRAFTPVFDGLRVAPTNTDLVQPLHFN